MMSIKKNSEQMLIDYYNHTMKYLEYAEQDLEGFYNQEVDKMIEETEDKSNLTHIKERLKPMPNIGAKVLLFRKIILIENKNKV